ncbi:hypothetical protein AVEN_239828-1 [Araneus ventricosus]|uniref:Uncharacterized protein n=1 Tax=Araneus ventricosus TaxID=182803 RepID=A0A4Y2MNZ7_ARAVE|nr:hypothetical protein AVEN_97840-1 [Araneus ventricosus]GBN28884.1 hypothetical protein AVEN_239828-1 [Araneus ventricosus]
MESVLTPALRKILKVLAVADFGNMRQQVQTCFKKPLLTQWRLFPAGLAVRFSPLFANCVMKRRTSVQLSMAAFLFDFFVVATNISPPSVFGVLTGWLSARCPRLLGNSRQTVKEFMV